ncbi:MULTISPECIES: hypothetical protein [unclassified Providencia]|uniref:hypothetical protein n=1 Tax=unclassified Providencia TaxID=2633465 RepID=UPI002349496C|nr:MULTISPECIES: hypothetical protein [unclassified Providencia]
MPIVTITPKYKDNSVYRKYAAKLSAALNGVSLSGYVGKFADFRNSGIARQSFITPDAHARSDALLPVLSDMAESHFHSLSLKELAELDQF